MRLITWLKEHRPSRDAMMKNRWLRPFARTLGDPRIWLFNRKSVARGVALGLFFGVAVPFAQAPAAALFALPLRANLAVAALVTFVSNPLTTPFIYLGAYEVGRWMLRMEDGLASLFQPGGDFIDQFLAVLAAAPLPILTGMLTLGTLGAAAGYFIIDFVWRLWIQQRAAVRRHRQLAAERRQ